MFQLNLKILSEQVAVLLFFLVALTSSWDSLFAIKVNDYTVRIVNIFVMVSIFWGVAAYKKNKTTPPGALWLLWAVVINFLVGLQYANSHSVLYACLFTYFFLFLCFAPCVFSRSGVVKSAMRAYIKSFELMAIIGILQFCLACFLSIDFFVAQWWVVEILPRVNGFSYEPSYFATYLAFGWGMVCAGVVAAKSGFKRYTYILLSVAVILSSSRAINIISGCALLVVVGVCLFLKKMKSAYIAVKLLAIFALLSLLYFVITTFVSGGIENGYRTLLAGTGVGGLPSHSVSERASSANDVIAVFFNSPIIGVSYGQVPYEIAKIRGTNVGDHTEYKNSQGNVVVLEALAALGLIGVGFMASWLCALVASMVKIIDECSYAIPLLAGFILGGVAMQFNQNIFRFYFWVHLVIMSSCAISFSKNYHASKR